MCRCYLYDYAFLGLSRSCGMHGQYTKTQFHDCRRKWYDVSLEIDGICFYRNWKLEVVRSIRRKLLKLLYSRVCQIIKGMKGIRRYIYDTYDPITHQRWGCCRSRKDLIDFEKCKLKKKFTRILWRFKCCQGCLRIPRVSLNSQNFVPVAYRCNDGLSSVIDYMDLMCCCLGTKMCRLSFGSLDLGVSLINISVMKLLMFSSYVSTVTATDDCGTGVAVMNITSAVVTAAVVSSAITGKLRSRKQRRSPQDRYDSAYNVYTSDERRRIR